MPGTFQVMDRCHYKRKKKSRYGAFIIATCYGLGLERVMSHAINAIYASGKYKHDLHSEVCQWEDNAPFDWASQRRRFQ